MNNPQSIHQTNRALLGNYVDYSLVTPGRSDEEAYLNAKLSISIARKMGATIWSVSAPTL